MTDSKSDPAINSDDAALFREVTHDVRPLKNKNRVNTSLQRPPLKAKTDDSPQQKHSFFEIDRDDPLLEMVQSEESLFYLRGELPSSTLKQFRRGDLCSTAELDLHGLSSADAAIELDAFIKQGTRDGVRCFQLIHGKGNRSIDQLPILKSRVNQWLRRHESVLAFCSARQRDGGTGALYVLLKRRNI